MSRPALNPAVERDDPVALVAGPLRAAFDPRRGMLGTSLRHDGEELLGPLGMPFLHPWANRLSDPLPGTDVPRDDRGLPIHGVHPRRWNVEAVRHTALMACLTFDAEPVFPYAHRVVHLVRASGSTLRIETTVQNTGPRPMPVAFGFHPYFRLQSDEIVCLPARTHLLADERLLPTGQTVQEPAEIAPLGTRTFDDGYAVAPNARFGIGRRLQLALVFGYTHAQVYAPAGEGVICFEPMTAPVNALVTGDGLRHVASGGSLRAAFEIRVQEVVTW